ncbi:MAG: sulfur carrier protein ThiS [Hylemonella sp.]|nr:sulfur carrier protein ThiS [Hylemonella sp.]MDH5707796.1 sulfur carrier protein ThiS [Hylemonella sp.]
MKPHADIDQPGAITLRLNGQMQQVRAGCTVQELVSSLGLANQALAVAVNQEVVPRSDWHRRALQAQDRVELVRPVGGG